MIFRQPCFIRKNTPELRKKLEELGYKPSYPIFQYPEAFKHIAACNFFGSKYYGVSDDEVSHHGEIIDAIKNGGMIDCGTNELLFLSLAALRDDTDANQWFICDKEYITNNIVEAEVGEWIYIFEDDLEKLPGLNFYDYFHKATAEEIVEHFNK